MKNVLIIVIITLFGFIACDDTNSLPSGKLTEGVWMSNYQLSELYEVNDISVTVSLRFTYINENKKVEVYEGSGLSKSCVCSGKYSLSRDRKSLNISGLSNVNCPWMNKLNGNYIYSKDDRMLYFNNRIIKIATLK